MYFVIEIQKHKDGSGTSLVTTKEKRNEAESEYYRIMQYAALSDLPKHGAIIVNEDCAPIMYSCYEHIEEPEPEITEEQ